MIMEKRQTNKTMFFSKKFIKNLMQSRKERQEK